MDNLRPNTTYMFLVRARNSHGLSLPSPVTDVITSTGARRQLRRIVLAAFSVHNDAPAVVDLQTEP